MRQHSEWLSMAHRAWRPLLGTTVAVLILVSALPAPEAQPVIDANRTPVNPGYLYVDRVVPKDKAAAKGFVPPAVFVYRVQDDMKSSVRISNGGYETGEPIPLSEGWYDVEIAQFPAADPANKHRYYVKRGYTTVVQTGLLSIQTLPEADQPPDVCQPWSAALTIMSVNPDKDGHTHAVLMSGNAGYVKDRGLLQLHPGRYRVEWNGLHTDIDVVAGESTPVRTGFVGPMRGKQKYQIHQEQGESASNAVIAACEKRPTQVLVGSFWGSYLAPVATDEGDDSDSGVVSMSATKRSWEPLVVDPHRAETSTKVSGDRMKGVKLYKDKGSRPDEQQ